MSIPCIIGYDVCTNMPDPPPVTRATLPERLIVLEMFMII